MPNRDFEIEMKLKGEWSSAKKALDGTEDGLEKVTDAAGRANTALDKSSDTQANRIREMVQRSIAELDAARAQVDDASGGNGASGAAGQAAGTRELTAAQQAQAQAMRASQQAISAEIGLIGDLQSRLSRAAGSMDDLADTEARLDTAMAKGLINADEYDDALAQLTKEQARLEAATAKTDKTITTTVGRYDKASVALDKLTRDEAQLKAAVDAGRISREQYNRAMDSLTTERTRLSNLRDGAEQSATSMRKLNLQSAEAQRNLAQLVTYSATGQWQMAGSQILQLGNAAGVASVLFSTAGLAVAGFGGALLGVAAAQAAGYLQMRALDNAIISTGNSLGTTAGALAETRNQAGALTGDFGDAQKAVEALAGSGELSADGLQAATNAAVSLAEMTGRTIEDTTNQVIALAKAPTATLLELNNRYHFLTLEVYENVASLEAQGRAQEAAQAATEALEKATAERVAKMREQAGSLERAWYAVRGAISAAIQAAKDVGREDIEYAIATGERGIRMRLDAIADLRDAQQKGIISKEDADSQVAGIQAIIQRQAQALVQLHQQKDAQDAVNKAKAEEQSIQDKAVSAAAGVDKQLAATDKKIERQQRLNKLIEDYNAIAVANPNDKRLFDGSYDKLKKAIEDSTAEKGVKATGSRASLDPDKGAQRDLDNLKKQAALLADVGAGETKASEAARVRYEIEQGAYAKVSPQLQQQLVDQAQLVDSERALTAEQKKKDDAFKETQRSYQQLLDSLRTPAEVALDKAIAQVKSLNDAIKAGVPMSADYTDSIQRIGAGTIGDAPKVKGLAPEVGGASSELTRIDQEQQALEKWNADKLKMIAEGRAQEGANQAVWDAADLDRAKKHQDALNQIEQAKGSARLSLASDFLGQIAQLQNSQNSKAARIGKAAAIGQALVNTYKSATEAYAAMAGIPTIGPALGAAAAAAAIAAGMAQVSAIRSTATGYATGGHIRGAGTGTSDSIPIWASDYEFMTRAAVVKQPGALPFLEDFNTRGMSALYDWTDQARYATGGLIAPAAPTAPNWSDMQRRQEAATQPAKVDFYHRGINVFDIDEVAKHLGNSREFEKVTVTAAVNNGKKIQAGWG